MTDRPDLTDQPLEMRTRAFWRLLGYAAVLGVVGVVAGLVFLGVTGIGSTIYGEPSLDWFGGPVWWVGVAAAAGAIVGLLRRAMQVPRQPPNIIDDLQHEHVDAGRVPGIVAVSAVSLIGGASLGPEVALGQMGGGAAERVASVRGLDEDDTKSLTLSGIAGAFGGLFTSPIVAMALVLEIARTPRQRFERTFFGSLVASSIAFGLYFTIVGSVFLGIYTVPEYAFRDWYLLAGVGLGVLAAGVAIATIALAMIASRAFARLPITDLAKPVIGGVAFGLIAVVVPLTAFTGSEQLSVVLSDAGTLGLGLLIAILVGKMLAFAVSIGSGFIGGPIFPVMFIGGTSGVIVNQVFPDVPLGLAFSAMLAAVPGAVVSAPFSLVLLAALLTQVGALQTAPILIAVGSASLVVAVFRSVIADRARR